MTRGGSLQIDMREEKIIRERLEQLRHQFLNWGVPGLQVFEITKDETRSWIRALEWVLGATVKLPSRPSTRQ